MERILFPTLRAELARKGLKPEKVIQESLGVAQKTAYNKLTGASDLMLTEAVTIRDKNFPDMTLDELFLSERKGA